MEHIFICYSRKDKKFAIGLKNEFEKSGKEVWIDLEDLPVSAIWRKEIEYAIISSTAFIYLVSTNSLHSEYCQKELNSARQINKRIFPIFLPQSSENDIPGNISSYQWLTWEDLGNDLSNLGKLIKDIETDYEWIKFHTELHVRASQWEQGQDESLLLRGTTLQETEKLIGLTGQDKNPQPTDLQRRYLSESRVAEDKQTNRQLKQVKALAEEERKRAEEQEISARHNRNLSIVMTAIAIVAIFAAFAATWFGGQLGIALVSEQVARENADKAQAAAEKNLRFSQARELALAAVDEIQNRQDSWGTLPVFLALESISKTLDTDGILLTESDVALQKALGATPLRWLSIDLLNLSVSGNGPGDIVFFPDGQSFLITSYLERVDVDTGEIIHSYEDYHISVWDTTSIRSSANFISYYDSEEDLVKIWNTEEESLAFEIKPSRENPQADYSASAFSPNGKYFYYAMDKEAIRVISMVNGMEIKAIGPVTSIEYSVEYMEISLNNNIIAISDMFTINLWDNTRDEMLLVIPLEGALLDLEFSPDSTKLIFVEYLSDAHYIHIWNLRTLEEENQIYPSLGTINSVDFSPDGKFFAFGGCTDYDFDDPDNCEEARLLIFETSNFEEYRRISYNSGSITTVAFTPDGNSIIAAGCLEKMECTRLDVRLFNLKIQGGEMEKIDRQQGSIYSIDISPNQAMMVSGGEDGLVRIWDTNSWEEIHTFDDSDSTVQAVAFSPQGNTIAAADADGKIRVWDIKTKQLIQTISDDGSIYSLKFSPDGTLLVSVNDIGYVVLWSVETGERINQVGVSETEYRSDFLAFSPDGITVAIASSGQESYSDYDFSTDTYLWNSTSSQRDFQHLGDVDHPVDSKVVVFSPDGEYLAAGSCVSPLIQAEVCSRGKILIWKTKFPYTLMKTMEGHVGWITTITYSADGKLLATGGEDGMIWIWDAETGEEVRRLWGHTGVVRSIVFSNDGKKLVSASDDGSIRIWYVDIRDLIQLARERYKDYQLSCQERRQFLHEELECPAQP